MKVTLTFLLIIYAISSVFAQDKITRTNGDVVHCDIESIDSTQVYFYYAYQNDRNEKSPQTIIARTFLKLNDISSIAVEGMVYANAEFTSLNGKTFPVNITEQANQGEHSSPASNQTMEEGFKGFYISPYLGLTDFTDPAMDQIGLGIAYMGSQFICELDLSLQATWYDVDMYTSFLIGKYIRKENARYQIQLGPSFELGTNYFGLMIKGGPRAVLGRFGAIGIDVQAHIHQYPTFGLLCTLELGKLK